MTDSVAVHPTVLDTISAEAAHQREIECCGLLGGRDGTITRIYPARNALASATVYEIAPKDLFRIMRQMRADGVELMGIYHSHPTGDNSPSPTDVARAFYPDAIYLIASPTPICHSSSRVVINPIRAFQIRDTSLTELRIKAVGSSAPAS
jgi:proteasome lid subunit RPN8/RPN11